MLASLAGCSDGEADPDEFTNNLNTLNRAAQQGEAARTVLSNTGTRPTNQSCGALYDATAASKVVPNTPEFIAQGKVAFVNGCMGRASVPTTTAPPQ